MFTTTWRRLMLSYTTVLGALLLLSGVLLYFGLQVSLLGPIDGRLNRSAHIFARYWQERNRVPCAGTSLLVTPRGQAVPYVACFDSKGNLLHANSFADPLTSFIGTRLARRALASPSGSASDTISVSQGLGSIQRYALVVHTPTADSTVMGVVQVGIPVGDLHRSLDTVLLLLIGVGTITLVGSFLGGLYLSRRALAPARQAFARQQTFIADASHELRTPLTILRADAEALLRGRERLAPDDMHLIEDIMAEAVHMHGLVTNLLALARFDAGTSQIRRDVVDLATVAEETVRRSQVMAPEREVALHVEPAPPTLVLGDESLLEQAALIPVDNAIKYSRPRGQVTVSVGARDDQAQLRVRDTGIGIPADVLPRLGERFFRVEKSRARAGGGSGLGLAIAAGVACAHRGKLRIASMPGVGTSATLQLPCLAEVPDS
jgi:signal transduction histidine kinase